MVLSSPYRQADFDRALAHMLTSPERATWGEAGLRYTADIAARHSPASEAEYLEALASERRG